jgi:hypothetical protein
MAKKKTEEAKKTKKASKMIPITFKPQFSAAQHKTINLKKPEVVVVGGQTRTEYTSQIEGLPPEFTIHKDEVVEVTLEQFKALYERGEIDTPESIAERERERLMLSNQVGTNPKEFVVAKNRAHLYQDGFVLADPDSIDLTRIE